MSTTSNIVSPGKPVSRLEVLTTRLEKVEWISSKRKEEKKKERTSARLGLCTLILFRIMLLSNLYAEERSNEFITETKIHRAAVSQNLPLATRATRVIAASETTSSQSFGSGQFAKLRCILYLSEYKLLSRRRSFNPSSYTDAGMHVLRRIFLCPGNLISAACLKTRLAYHDSNLAQRFVNN